MADPPNQAVAPPPAGAPTWNAFAWHRPDQATPAANRAAAGGTDFPTLDSAPATVWARFEALAARAPDSVALTDGQVEINYATARDIALGMAARIVAASPPGGAVALLMPQSPCIVLGLLACLAAGRVALLVNTEQPAERIGQMLAEGQPALILVQSGQAALSATAPMLVLDRTARPEVGFAAPDSLAPEAPAFVMFTSGSSGQPKGIAQSQAALLYRAHYQARILGLRRTDRVLSLSLVHMFAGLIPVMCGLLTGAAIVAIPLGSPGTILEIIARSRASILKLIPGMLRLLLAGAEAPARLASVRAIRTTGEPIPRDEIGDWRAVLPVGCHIIHAYNQTEISIATWLVPPDFTGAEATLPCGYLDPGLEYALLDEHGTALPPAAIAAGEAGELVLRSPWAASGEWQAGRCVPGRFLADPADPSLTIVRTGDLVRLRPDGLLHFAGRGDRMVKIHGQRVEPAEIEAALRKLPAIQEASVLATRAAEQAQLVAFVQGRGALPDVAETLAALRQKLPSYMVPARLVALEEFPRLPNGKLDLIALLTHAEAPPPPPEPPAPADPSPLLLAQLGRSWVHVLDRASLRADRTFDDSGGDSMKLLLLLLHLEKQCGQSLPLDRFHGGMRPSEMAAELDACLTPEAGSEAPGIFVLPGIGGGENRIARFRAACAPDLRVEMLSYGDWHSWTDPAFAFPDLIRRMADRLEARQPTGPIRLAGYSLGGFIAFETARELMARGREFAFLGLIDTDLSIATDASATRRNWAGEMARLWQGQGRGGGVNGIAMVLARMLTTRPFAPLLRHLSRRPPVSLPGDLDLHLRRALNLWLMGRLTQAWRRRHGAPRPLPGVALTLFRSAHPRPAELSEAMGWETLCAAPRVVHVPGTHYTMFDPPYLATLRQAFAESVAAT